ALKLGARVFDLTLELAQGLRRLSAKGGKNVRSSSAWHTGPPLVDRMSRIKVKRILLQAGERPVATNESCPLVSIRRTQCSPKLALHARSCALADASASKRTTPYVRYRHLGRHRAIDVSLTLERGGWKKHVRDVRAVAPAK